MDAVDPCRRIPSVDGTAATGIALDRNGLSSLQATLVNNSVQGSGDVHAAGNADQAEVETMCSGDVRTVNLIARVADVKIMASGDAVVHAKEKLIASVSGSADVSDAGSPANVSRTVRRSGRIEAR